MNKYFILFLSLIFVLPIKSQQNNKIILCEIMTSSTCPPCASTNPYFDNWLKNSQYKDRIAVIKYHTWWPSPGNDPYYQLNVSDNQTRINYYQPGSKYVPRASVDGTDKQDNASSWINGIINQLNSPTLLTLDIKNFIDSTGTRSQIQINVKSEDAVFPTGTFVLHVAIVENDLLYTGPNGDPIHQFVMRKMYPSAIGEEFSLSSGETKKILRNINWNTSWKFYKSKIVAFVQMKESKQVLNAIMLDVNSIPTNIQENSLFPLDFSLSQNYPNPFNPSTVIDYQLPSISNVTITVFDLLGKEVKKIINKQQEAGRYSVKFDASEINSGIYYYELKAGSFRAVKKMIVIK